MSEWTPDPTLVFEIRWHHQNGETYAEQFAGDWWAGIYPRDVWPSPRLKRRRRGPCPIKRMRRNDVIVKAVQSLLAQGASLRAAYIELELALDLDNLKEKAIETAYRNRRNH